MTEQLGWWRYAPWFNLAAPANLVQPILPDWSLQRIEVNFAGDVAIEKEVVGKVASYGKQLGILTEAVLALAGDAPEEREARIQRLRKVAAEVERIKKEHEDDLAASARRAMQSLAKVDRREAQRIATEYAKGDTREAGWTRTTPTAKGE